MLLKLRSGVHSGCLAIALVAGLFLAAPAWAGPFGLVGGDELINIEIDGLNANGDDVSFDVSLGAKGGLVGDGRSTAMVVQRGVGPPTVLPTPGTRLTFAANLLNYFGNFAAAPILNSVSVFSGVAGGPDFSLNLGPTTVLEGNFTTNMVVVGVVNTSATSDVLLVAANIAITGGVANIVDLFGPSGAGLAQFSVTVGNFSPSLASLAADGNVVNSNFIAAFSGIVSPVNSVPFVPEPGTALLLGAGLVGMLGVARRTARNRRS